MVEITWSQGNANKTLVQVSQYRAVVASGENWVAWGKNVSGCLSMLVFWVVIPCGLVGRYKRFGGAYCLHLQGWSPHGDTTQKTTMDIVTAVRTSNLIHQKRDSIETWNQMLEVIKRCTVVLLRFGNGCLWVATKQWTHSGRGDELHTHYVIEQVECVSSCVRYVVLNIWVTLLNGMETGRHFAVTDSMEDRWIARCVVTSSTAFRGHGRNPNFVLLIY
jgi:hypothetical protein